jgi:hypothetical protein
MPFMPFMNNTGRALHGLFAFIEIKDSVKA